MRSVVSRKTTDFIIVYGALQTGGTDSLIVRLANFLTGTGSSVTVYCMPGGDLQYLLNAKVTVRSYQNSHDFLSLAKKLKKQAHSEETIVLSVDSSSAARGEILALALPYSAGAVHVTAILHPSWYFMPGQPLDRILLNELLALSIGGKNIFFMNDECRTEHANKWKRDLSNSPIIPLPVNFHIPLWIPRKSESIRIVSVGRLVDFKAYNRGAAQVVRACLDRGIHIVWDIYGYGPQEREIERLAVNFGVEQNLRLMGKLDYEEFSTTVAGYDLFVGMGTAVIEAAMVGVPSICAAINELDRSYGYVSELPFGNVGELIHDRPLQEIKEIICTYAKLPMAKRLFLSNNEIQAARRYDMSLFTESLLHMARACESSSRRFRRYIVARIYFSVTDGLIARMFLGRGWKRKFLRIFQLRRNK